MKRIVTICLSLMMTVCLLAQPGQGKVKVSVAPDHSDWIYTCGQKSRFTVSVSRADTLVRGARLYYEIAEDQMDPRRKGELVLEDGEAVIEVGTMRRPGFLRLTAWTDMGGSRTEGMATAGFDIDRLAPTVREPADFDAFWTKVIEANNKLPLKPQIKLLEDRCTPEVDVYLASYQTARAGARFYGTLCVPRNRSGRLPAILIVPGAGCRARKGYFGMAREGYVTLELGINGIPTTMDDAYYATIRSVAGYRYYLREIDDKDHYAYKDIYAGCARAVDFLASLDFVDPDRIGVTGGSQGGALTITTTVLNPKVKCCGIFYPAMCDLTGFLYGRGGGWPGLFKDGEMATKARKETVPYFDCVNFARRIKVPTFYSYGFNDPVCCPTSTTAAYNVLDTDKVRHIFKDTQHWTYPEQEQLRWDWMKEHLAK